MANWEMIFVVVTRKYFVISNFVKSTTTMHKINFRIKTSSHGSYARIIYGSQAVLLIHKGDVYYYNFHLHQNSIPEFWYTRIRSSIPEF